MPLALILDKDFERFLYQEAEITAAGLASFIQQWQQNQLAAYLKSEPEPAEPYQKGVRQLVGTNFKSVVYDRSRHVLVYFYSPLCGHCKTVGPEIAIVAQHFQADSSIEVASIDLTKNEVEGLTIDKFPTIKLYSADNKEGIEYTGLRTGAPMIEFVQRETGKTHKTDL